MTHPMCLQMALDESLPRDCLRGDVRVGGSLNCVTMISANCRFCRVLGVVWN